MNDSGDTKVCPHCAETIKAAAIVCPHCRYWQKKWSLYNPKVLSVVGLVFMTVYFAGFVMFFERAMGRGRDFAKYRDQILVLDSQFGHRMYNSNLWVTVVGTATNLGDYTWKNVAVEAQFFDKSGRMIDAISADEDYRGFTILPHGEAAFKIEGKATQPPSEYTNHKVFVRTAKDVRQRF